MRQVAAVLVGSLLGLSACGSSPGFCGDGIIDLGEACDEGTANSDLTPDACRSTCLPPSCGDGIVDSGEACDEGAANSDSTPNACRSSCQLPSCGDGVVDEDEYCDCGANVCELPLDCQGCRQVSSCYCPDSHPGGSICIRGWARYLIDPDDPGRWLESPMVFDTTTLEVRVHDPLAYLENVETPPLATALVDPQNGCFRVLGIVVPPTNFLLLLLTEHQETPAGHFANVGSLTLAAAGNNLNNLWLPGITVEQHVTWTQAIGPENLAAAGCGTDASLADCSTWIGVYGFWDDWSLTTIAGVTPSRGSSGEAIIPFTEAYYLGSSLDELTRATSDAENHTNETGTVFVPNAALGIFSGACADLTPDSVCETAGYTWTVPLSGGIPDAITVQLMPPEGFDQYP